MDSTIYPLLDRMREEQLQQGALLQDIIEGQEESVRLLRTIGKLLREPSAPSKKLTSILPQGSLTTGVQYLAAIAGAAYLLKGGDLEKLTGLLKLLGLP
jgi:hypothetical protein